MCFLQRDDCVEDAKKADIFKKSNKTFNAKDIVTDNFLCSGGISPITDHIACKGMFHFRLYLSV